ncbi:hypothetical protein FRC09_004475 [Ceratobasidium sp. 395]|nr:hypothetical protein FRC09_004475 [Ceratobasidium sp. 395]
MRVTLATLLTLVAYVAAQADPSINTPAQLVQCQPAQITWTATKTPVFISIIPGGQPGAAALKDFGQQTGNSLTWKVDMPAGQSITMQVRDSAGAVAYSAPATIQSSSDSSCLGQNPSSSPSGGSSAPAPTSSAAQTSSIQSVSSVAETSAASVSTSVAASTSAAASSSSAAVSTSSRASATAPGSTSRSASATSASPSASTAPNSARSNAKVGLAGLLGLAAAVVMA